MFLVKEIIFISKTKAKVKLEDGFTFALYKGEIYKYRIKENEYVKKSIIEDICKNVLYKRGRERALYLLRDSAKTKMQIVNKLKQGYYPENVISKVIEFLEKYSYIDDYAFAYNYFECNNKRKSILQIKNELYIKGIGKNIIDEVLNTIEISDEQSLKKIMVAKIGRYDLNDDKDKRKFYSMLLRKGFSYDAINRSLLDITSI